MLSLLHQYYGPLRLPSHRLPLHLLGLIGSRVTAPCYRVGEGLPSSEHNCPHMPFPIHRRVFPCCSKFFARSMAFAIHLKARLPLVPFGVRLTMRQDSLGYYGLWACFTCFFFHAFRRASTHGFRHVLPTSYGAAWPLPRLNFHQRVMPSLARRTSGFMLLIFRYLAHLINLSGFSHLNGADSPSNELKPVN